MVHQGQRQPQALLHPQGKLLELLFAGVVEAHLLQSAVHTGLPGDPPLAAVILQVLPRRQIGVKAGDLHHGPDPGPGGGDPLLTGLSEELDLPGGGHGLGGQHADDRGLARAVAPHQAVDLPFFDIEVHALHRRSAAVLFGQCAGHQYGFRHMASAFLFWDHDASIGDSQQIPLNER